MVSSFFKFVTTFLVVFSLKSSAQNVPSHFQDTSIRIRIDSLLTYGLHKKDDVKKRKIMDSVQFFYFDKTKKQITCVLITYKNKTEAWTYFYVEGNFAKAIFRPKQNSSVEAGGIYYFWNNRLIRKEEYNIQSQPEDQIVGKARYYNTIAQSFLL